MRIRLGRGFWSSKLGLVLLGAMLCFVLTGLGIFTYYYISYGRMIDQRLSGSVFQNTSGIYTDAGLLFVGQAIAPADLIGYLDRSGYTKNGEEGIGRYIARGSAVEIYPEQGSYFHATNLLKVEFRGRQIIGIWSETAI